MGIESSYNETAVYAVLDNGPGTITILGQLASPSAPSSASGTAQNQRLASWVVPNNHLAPNSPCIGRGVGPAADPNAPTTDLDGRPRMGATCDVGPYQYAPTTGFAPWGEFDVPSDAGGANFQHCVFENGARVNVDVDAAFSDCRFWRNDNGALHISTGSTPLTNLTADHNRDAGVVAPGHNLTNCSASYNNGNGLEGAGLTGCTALANTGGGLVGRRCGR